MKKNVPKIDIGLTWAKGINIWGQLGMIAGMANTFMLVGVFYTTTIYPNFDIPLWLYIIAIIFVFTIAVAFILRYGISGYYRFFSKQSEMSEINKKVGLIMKHLDIVDDNKSEKGGK